MGTSVFSNNLVGVLEFSYVWFEEQELLPMSTNHIKILKWLEVRINRKIKHRYNRLDLCELRLILLAFRGAGKSSLLACFCAWLLYCNSDLRIFILSAELSLAKKLLNNTLDILLHHRYCIKMQQADYKIKRSSEYFTIQRTKKWRDPSMIAKGIRANITGLRAEWIICDDVEVPNTSGSYDKRSKLRECLMECEYILTSSGSILFAGTPHTKDSIYLTENDIKGESSSNMGKTFLKKYDALKIPVLDEYDKSTWFERFSLNRIQQIRDNTSSYKFSNQMLLKFSEHERSRLNLNLLGSYRDNLQFNLVSGGGYYSINGKVIEGVNCFWDPSFGKLDSDGSTVAVVFRNSDLQYLIHDVIYLNNFVEEYRKNNSDSIRERTIAEIQCNKVMDVIKDYNIREITVEQNGVGMFLPQLLEQELKKSMVICKVVRYSSKLNKQKKILEAFDTLLNSGRLFINDRLSKSLFMEEFKNWNPYSRIVHDDGLDAVASSILLMKNNSYNSRLVRDKDGNVIAVKGLASRDKRENYFLNSNFDVFE